MKIFLKTASEKMRDYEKGLKKLGKKYKVDVVSCAYFVESDTIEGKTEIMFRRIYNSNPGLLGAVTPEYRKLYIDGFESLFKN